MSDVPFVVMIFVLLSTVVFFRFLWWFHC